MSIKTDPTTIKAPPGYYKLTGHIQAKTAAAVLFKPESINDLPLDEEDENTKAQWFPLSQVKSILNLPEDIKAADANAKEVIIVSQWIASKKGLV